ncbi:MAG TPA: hypothetical protein VJ461_06360 [Candidatus Nanoarchaeia archaeon]|nr:hypothetical protein [Candidatus Nanoarchaeia archaeon]
MVIITVQTKEKYTTLRLSERTKKMLEAQGKGKETHEQILLRLIKISENLSSEQGSQIMQKGNVIGTKYERLNKTFGLSIDDKKYLVVCTYNDLSIMATIRNKKFQQVKIVGSPNHMPIDVKNIDWEIDLEIVNVNKGNGWVKPTTLSFEERNLLYFICLKQVLEETFDIKLYQLSNIEDYTNIDTWNEIYSKHGLSRDSLRSDIKEKIK